MAASARGLARLIHTARPVPGLGDNPLRQPYEGLLPLPHSPLFDFDATAAGAEWIDELARRAKPLLGLGRVVVAHTDWAARNVRLSARGILAVYDLDSLAVGPLPAALGPAPSPGGPPPNPATPPPRGSRRSLPGSRPTRTR